jgi:hypothetical protein
MMRPISDEFDRFMKTVFPEISDEKTMLEMKMVFFSGARQAIECVAKEDEGEALTAAMKELNEMFDSRRWNVEGN